MLYFKNGLFASLLLFVALNATLSMASDTFISTPRFNTLIKPDFSRDFGMDNVESVGLIPTVKLSESLGNLYYELKLCNTSKRKISLWGGHFDSKKMIRSMAYILFNGKLLRDKLPSGPHFTGDYEDVVINDGVCLAKTYNFTRLLGLYRVKGNYLALYYGIYSVGFIDEESGEKQQQHFLVKSNVAKLVIK